MAETLRQLRWKTNLSVSDVVTKVNSVLSKEEEQYKITPKAIQKWESGVKQAVFIPKQLLQVCKVYNVDPSKLRQAFEQSRSEYNQRHPDKEI